MSGREVDVDALFERDADNRLLDRRRRTELGLAAHAPAASASPPRFGAESIVGDDPRPAPAPRGALLRVALDARPDRELIPGAVVTVVAAVHDDGDAEAGDVRVRIAIPPEAEPVPGSFARDGVAIDGDALLGEGLRLGAVPAGGETRLRFTLRVLPGTEPLDVVVHALAAGVPAVGAPALRLRRRSGHAAYGPPRPFYELEDQEHDPDLVAVPVPAPLAAPAPARLAEPPRRAVDTVLDEPALPPVIAREPEPHAAPQPRVEPAASPAAPPPAGRLVRPLGLDDVRGFERVFAGGVPHGLAALSLLAGIACTGGPLGTALGLEPFRAAVAAALPRALVAARMRKPTPPVVSSAALAEIRPDGDALADPADSAAPGGPALVAALDRRELDDPFLRGAQVLLAVAPRALAGAGHDAAARAGDVLAAYRVAAGAWLMRVTVRRAVDRRYDPLTADDVALRDAGAALVTVLREVLS